MNGPKFWNELVSARCALQVGAFEDDSSTKVVDYAKVYFTQLQRFCNDFYDGFIGSPGYSLFIMLFCILPTYSFNKKAFNKICKLVQQTVKLVYQKELILKKQLMNNTSKNTQNVSSTASTPQVVSQPDGGASLLYRVEEAGVSSRLQFGIFEHDELLAGPFFNKMMLPKRWCPDSVLYGEETDSEVLYEEEKDDDDEQFFTPTNSPRKKNFTSSSTVS